MKNFLLIPILTVIVFSAKAFSQDKKETFCLTDTAFNIGATCTLQIKWSMCGSIIMESVLTLDSVSMMLENHPELVIEIEEHTDCRGSAEYMEMLTQKRAESYMDFLVEKGANPFRVSAIGYGGSQPEIVDDSMHDKYEFLPAGQLLDIQFIRSLDDPEKHEVAHQYNRRTIIKIVDIRK